MGWLREEPLPSLALQFSAPWRDVAPFIAPRSPSSLTSGRAQESSACWLTRSASGQPKSASPALLAAQMPGAFGVSWALRMTHALPGTSDLLSRAPFYDPATLSIVAVAAPENDWQPDCNGKVGILKLHGAALGGIADGQGGRSRRRHSGSHGGPILAQVAGNER
jgi:hypothetical protein